MSERTSMPAAPMTAPMTAPVVIALSPASLRRVAELQAQKAALDEQAQLLVRTIVEQTVDVGTTPGWRAQLVLPNIVVTPPESTSATDTPSGHDAAQ
jgi:hypothetical protein